VLLEVAGRAAFAATGGRSFDRRLGCVAFVHGAGMDHTVFALQARYFAHHGHSVLAVDLPGHGRSAGPPLSSVESLAAWLPRLFDAAGVEAAALVGHSMGALVVLEAARQAPGRVERLAMLGVAAAMPVHPDLLAAARAGRPEAGQLIASWGHGRAGHVGGNPAPGLWRMEGGLRLLELASAGVLATDLAASAAYDALLAAPGVRCPTLLLLGAEDRMTPVAAAAALADAIGGARTTILPGCGHMLMSERPNEVIDALRGFLGGSR